MNAAGSTSRSTSSSTLSEFECHRQTLLLDEDDEGWQAKLQRYLKGMSADVSPDTDIIEWWQNHAQVYPTLAQIALDILPVQASSVPCERLFSASKPIADERRAHLGSRRFEELLLMKFTWRNSIADLAAWNSSQIEEVNLEEFKDLLSADELEKMLDEEGAEVIVDEF
ncbi:hypothetical protein Hypma_007292 [Hypsizygus marmoreus]|uniref:HAT C-terminal dimerisation domain-containing protein n=1 Tax=Hypsizygus marmoreus TaxID=39966 RepID=A0A369KCH0_HYPMA|nr:hypothetical protein Hypma_007292 [Hypsizygus marmoreus]